MYALLDDESADRRLGRISVYNIVNKRETRNRELRERENSSVYRNRTDTYMHTHTHIYIIYILYVYDRAQVDRWFIRKVNYRLALYGVRIRETGLTISPTSTIQNLYRLYNSNDLHIIPYIKKIIYTSIASFKNIEQYLWRIKKMLNEK